MSKRKVNEGDRFGSWTVLNYPVKSRKIFVRCDCGLEVWRFVSNFTSNKTNACVKCAGKLSAEKKTNNYSDEWKSRRLTHLIKSATTKDFELSQQEVWTITQSNCYYCGAEPSNMHKYSRGIVMYNGIDRIDSSKGYTSNNVRPACWKCNSAKKEMSDIEFMEWLEKIYGHWKNTTLEE